MNYTIDPRYRLTWNGDNVFLVDITEKNYGRGHPVLMLNREGGELVELLRTNTLESVADTFGEGERDPSGHRANIMSAVRTLCEAGVLKGDIPFGTIAPLPKEKT